MVDPSEVATPAARATATSRPRAAWGTISREQVIDLAINEIREGRYESMTIRSLAGQLGVSAMSLYRHVRNRDDLLDEVTDRLLAEAWRPHLAKADWRAWTSDAAKRLRRLLVTQPAALHVYLRHPVVTPAAMARMEEMLDVLRSAGFDDAGALRAYAAIHTYTIGFSALEASRRRGSPPAHDVDASTRRLAGFTSPRQFTEGLEILLAGVERHAGS